MYTIIIADDEEIERKALGLLLQKEFPEITVVGLAENGVELVSLTETLRPDMAIVDVNMPGINGIDAVELLRSREVPTRFIINTAYSDFDYVQRALSLKVDAYILKPQKRADTIATIRKLCASIDTMRANSQSQRQIQELFWRIQPVMESEIMYSIFMGEPSGANLATWCEMHAVQWHTGAMVSLLPADGNEALKTKEKGTLCAFLHSTLESSCTCLATVGESQINLLIFIPERESAGNRQNWLRDVLSVLLDKLGHAAGLLMKAGVGGIYQAFERMSDSYRESHLALQKGSGGPVSFYEPDSAAVSQEERLLGLARTLAEDAGNGRLHALDEHLEKANHLLARESDASWRLWQMCQSLILDAGRSGTELRAFFRVAGHVLHQETQADEAIKRLREKLRLLAGILSDRTSFSANAYVVQALQLLEDHYDRDLSLESVAAEIGISPFYLSRLLKAELGQTFVEYLTQVRMQEAMKLARTTRLTIKEIAERTGYQNPTYFCRVFKKYTGRTIGEIREQKLSLFGEKKAT